MKLGHVALTVKNVEKSLKFYEKLMGFKRAFELKDDDGEILIYYLRINEDQFIQIIPVNSTDNEKKVVSGLDIHPRGYHHQCYETDEIEVLFDKAVQFGCEIDKPLTTDDRDHNTQFWTRDPDGYPIEFMKMNKGSLQFKY